jgi:hypothetical protein
MAIREIPTPETLRQLLRYEPETGKLYWLERPAGMFTAERFRRTWNTKWAGVEAGWRERSYRQLAIWNHKIYAHRAVWAICYGTWPADQIDHINGDPADNRIENLRDCTAAENRKNASKNSRNTSGETGVTWNAREQYWQVTIGSGKTNWVGKYLDFDEAVTARRQAAKRAGYTDRHGR